MMASEICSIPINLGSSPNKTATTEADDIKVDSIAKRILKSPFFWGSVATIALIAFTAIVLTGVLAVAPIILAPVLGVGLIALGVTIYLYRDKIFYEMSLLVVLGRNILGQSWDHEIVEGKLVLGAIPLRNKHHIEKLKEDGVGAVLSLLKDFEFTHDTVFTVPVRKSEWAKRNIKHLHLNVSDLTPPSQEQIREGVKFIKDNIDAGLKVKVHCKAGVGRSAMEVICYLLENPIPSLMGKTGQERIDATIRYVSNIRWIHLSPSQKKAIRIFNNSIGNQAV